MTEFVTTPVTNNVNKLQEDVQIASNDAVNKTENYLNNYGKIVGEIKSEMSDVQTAYLNITREWQEKILKDQHQLINQLSIDNILQNQKSMCLFAFEAMFKYTTTMIDASSKLSKKIISTTQTT